MDTNPKKQRQHFYRDYAGGQWSMSDSNPARWTPEFLSASMWKGAQNPGRSHPILP